MRRQARKVDRGPGNQPAREAAGSENGLLHWGHDGRTGVSPHGRKRSGGPETPPIQREEDEDAGFEVEEQNGVLNVLFENPPGKFVITPNTPVRQIWISALSTSFKLDWDAKSSTFVLPRTGEQMIPLVDRLIQERGEG